MAATAKYLCCHPRVEGIAPAVLGTVSASSLIPIFRRQNTELRLAHAHAIMHVTRPFLLQAFADLISFSGPTNNPQRS